MGRLPGPQYAVYSNVSLRDQDDWEGWRVADLADETSAAHNVQAQVGSSERFSGKGHQYAEKHEPESQDIKGV